MNKIPFTIKFPQTKYTRDEVYNFWTTTKETQVEGSFKDEDQKERYIFLSAPLCLIMGGSKAKSL
jgi:hypothetical protein